MYNKTIYIADANQNFQNSGSGWNSQNSNEQHQGGSYYPKTLQKEPQKPAPSGNSLDIGFIFITAVIIFTIAAVSIIFIIINRKLAASEAAAKAAKLRKQKKQAQREQIYGSAAINYVNKSQTSQQKQPEEAQTAGHSEYEQPVQKQIEPPPKLGTPDSVEECIKNFLRITKDI